jgi:hypothetical protein
MKWPLDEMTIWLHDHLMKLIYEDWLINKTDHWQNNSNISAYFSLKVY